MKKAFLLLAFSIMALGVFAQKNKTEVLYFKAQLACCKANACNALENEIKSILEKTYTDGSVVFKQVPIADEANKELVTKYNAKSQTVVVVSTKKKKENSLDISDVIANYTKTNDKALLEKELIAKITESLK